MVRVPSNGSLTPVARQGSLHPSLVGTEWKRLKRPNSADQDPICAPGRCQSPVINERSRQVG